MDVLYCCIRQATVTAELCRWGGKLCFNSCYTSTATSDINPFTALLYRTWHSRYSSAVKRLMTKVAGWLDTPVHGQCHRTLGANWRHHLSQRHSVVMATAHAHYDRRLLAPPPAPSVRPRPQKNSLNIRTSGEWTVWVTHSNLQRFHYNLSDENGTVELRQRHSERGFHVSPFIWFLLLHLSFFVTWTYCSFLWIYGSVFDMQSVDRHVDCCSVLRRRRRPTRLCSLCLIVSNTSKNARVQLTQFSSSDTSFTGCMDVDDRVRYRVCVHVYKCLHNMAPGYLSALCQPVSGVPGRRHLRSAGRGELDFPRVNLSTYGGRTFAYAGPTSWNSLPDDLKNVNLALSASKRHLWLKYVTLCIIIVFYA